MMSAAFCFPTFGSASRRAETFIFLAMSRSPSITSFERHAPGLQVLLELGAGSADGDGFLSVGVELLRGAVSERHV
jgi:hypothetical protein